MKRPSTACSWLLLTIVAGSAVGAAGQAPRLRRAFDFSLPDWQGKTVRLSDYRRQVVVVNFFRTNCPICRREAPILEEFYREYKSKGVVVLGVSNEEGAADAIPKYAEEYDLTHPLLVGDLEVAVRYLGLTPQRSSYNTPHLFLINQEGYIVREFVRGRDQDFFTDERRVLEQAVSELLRPSPGQLPSPRKSD